MIPLRQYNKIPIFIIFNLFSGLTNPNIPKSSVKVSIVINCAPVPNILEKRRMLVDGGLKTSPEICFQSYSSISSKCVFSQNNKNCQSSTNY